MNFNFNAVAAKSQNVAGKPELSGNAIHTVLFKGCESKDIEKDGITWKVLTINFENKDGKFQKTYFEPKDQDNQPSVLDLGEMQITNPSNVTDMMFVFKHLIDAVNPVLSTEINEGKKQITAPNWDILRQFMVKATESGIDKETKIKLFKSKKGDAVFPRAAAFNREGEIYMRTNFIGDNIFFSKKEMEQIKKAEETKPDTIESTETKTEQKETVNPYNNVSASDLGDLNFQL